MARGTVVPKGKRWYCVFPHQGKQIWRVGGDTKTEAQARLRKYMQEFYPNENFPFKDFASDWLESHKIRLRPNTVDVYTIAVNRHIIPFFDGLTISEITPTNVSRFITEKAKTLHPKTVNNNFRILKQMLNQAVIYKHISESPAQHIQALPVPRQTKEFLGPDEIKQFLKACDPDYYPFFLTAVFTGGRISELLALRWDDINWTTNEITFRHSLVKGELHPTKNDLVGSVVVQEDILKELKKKERVINPLNLIFTDKKGQPLDRRYITRRKFEPALKKAGLRRVTFHSLRHSYASILLSLGVNIKVVQDNLRHRIERMTLDIYSHPLKKDRNEAAEKIGNLLTDF